jgi:hypothetical protein
MKVMTPKEKAKELLESFMFSLSKQLDLNTGEYQPIPTNPYYKECALIAVDEILNNFGLTANGQTFFTEHRAVQYYQEVKQEIKNL